jgi:hypothetical protein
MTQKTWPSEALLTLLTQCGLDASPRTLPAGLVLWSFVMSSHRTPAQHMTPTMLVGGLHVLAVQTDLAGQQLMLYGH